MKEIAEFRVPESYAKEFLPDDVGEKIMDFVRKIQTPVGSDLYTRIGRAYEIMLKRDQRYFFLGWDIKRIYSKKELALADLLLIKISKTFEPAGIECGTVYNTQQICDICGAGIQQISELMLDLTSAPKNVNIARTISNEIIIDAKFASALHDANTTGYQLGTVHHIGQDTKSVNRTWYQLICVSSVHVSSETKTGIGPFDEDINNEYRCKNGHTIGLDVLSEVSIKRESWDGSDIVVSKELLGVNRGLLRTYPLLIMSQRLYRLLQERDCRGFGVEVAHIA